MDDSSYLDIVTDVSALKREVSPAEGAPDVFGDVISPQTPDELGEALLEHLDHHGGIGLAANQVGIDARVCAVDVIEPFYLVNPVVVDLRGSTPFVEGCLSFPGDALNTERAVGVTVECDNYDGPLMFGPLNPEDFEAETVDDLDDPQLLESVAVQHEIDHLNGITFHEREASSGITFERESERYARNDLVVITHTAGDAAGTVMEIIKWKYRTRISDGVDWQAQGPAPEHENEARVLGGVSGSSVNAPSVFER